MKSRKFLLFILVYSVACLMFMIDKLTGSEYIEFTKWLFITYTAGNVGEWGVNALGDKHDSTK